MTSHGIRASGIALSGVAFGALVLLAAAPQDKVERGKYLVDRALLCSDCHTPADAKGMPDKTRLLLGAPIMFKPTVPVPAWADTAPALAGLVGYTDAHIVRALTTGVGPTGYALRPPMPPYRLSTEDAEAVVAYLKTLKRKPAAPKR